jgi:hypothetical protein
MIDPVQTLQGIHSELWRSRQTVSSATKTAIEITRRWQLEVTTADADFQKEFPVEGLGEKIDLVDTKRMVAYELKVSPNNTHMEFYRDVFKVLAHNEASQVCQRINKLIFIAPQEGAARLRRGLGEAACRISQKFGFSIEIRAMENRCAIPACSGARSRRNRVKSV